MNNEVNSDNAIPDSLIAAAFQYIEANDRGVVIGTDDYFGWVYRDAEDAAAMSLGNRHILDSLDGQPRPLGQQVEASL